MTKKKTFSDTWDKCGSRIGRTYCIMQGGTIRSFLAHSIAQDLRMGSRWFDHTISDSTGKPVSMESEIVTVVSLFTTEISEVTRLKSDLQGRDTLMSLLHVVYPASRLPIIDL